MRAAIGSQYKFMNRGVTYVLFGSLKINLAVAFWINWFDRSGWKTCQESIAIVKSRQNKSLNKELCCCSMFRKKGPDTYIYIYIQ